MPNSSTKIDTSSAIGLESEPERDEKVYSPDSDGVYVSEDETTSGERRADDNQLPFGFVKTHGDSALHDLADDFTIYLKFATTSNREWLAPYFGSLKG